MYPFLYLYTHCAFQSFYFIFKYSNVVAHLTVLQMYLRYSYFNINHLKWNYQIWNLNFVSKYQLFSAASHKKIGKILFRICVRLPSEPTWNKILTREESFLHSTAEGLAQSQVNLRGVCSGQSGSTQRQYSTMAFLSPDTSKLTYHRLCIMVATDRFVNPYRTNVENRVSS